MHFLSLHTIDAHEQDYTKYAACYVDSNAASR